MDPQFVSGLRLKSLPPDTSYLSRLPLVRSLYDQGEIFFDQPVTFFVGENGVGKSTLMEAMAVACGFNPEGGTRNFSFATARTESDLHEYMTLIRRAYPPDGFFLRAESFYNAASYLDEVYQAEFSAGAPTAYGDRSLHAQSHGESFLALVHNRFQGPGLYLLDEPESALSPTRLMSLLVEMDRLVRTGSQLFIATHSPILMAYPKAAIYELSEAGVRQVAYRDTEHYQLTRRFLEQPERMLHYLLEEEE